jgi:uncharacterized protein YegP (UPF0339 family)
MAAKFVIYQDEDGKHRFELVAANDEVVAESQAYVSADAARDGIDAVRRAVAETEGQDIEQGILSTRHRDAPPSS